MSQEYESHDREFESRTGIEHDQLILSPEQEIIKMRPSRVSKRAHNTVLKRNPGSAGEPSTEARCVREEHERLEEHVHDEVTGEHADLRSAR